MKKRFRDPQWNINSKVHLRSGEYSDYHGAQLVHVIRSAQDLVATEDKHIFLEANTYSGCSLRNST